MELSKNKTFELTLEQLRETVDETSMGNKSFNGIQHHVLIDTIAELSDKHGLVPELKAVVCQDTGGTAKPGISRVQMAVEKYGVEDHRSLIVRRLYTSLMYKTRDEHQVMGIGLTYTQEGIVLAIGPQVEICSNWCIYGYDQIASTYGPNRVAGDKLLDVYRGWMENYPAISEQKMKMMELMKAIEVQPHMAEQFFGRLQLARVGHDSQTRKQEWVYPMNQTQINTYAENYLRQLREYDTANGDNMNLWEFYNLGTEIMKPNTMELGNLLPQNLRMGTSILDFFMN